MFSKHQIKTFVILNFVLTFIILGAFINIKFHNSYNDSVNSNTNQVEYKTIREANISLNPQLCFETHLGGSDDEQLIDSFYNEQYNQLHVFFNTKSNDFDCQNNNGNICYSILDEHGKTQKFSFYGDKTDNLYKVLITNDGYLLAINGNIPKLLHINFNGDILRFTPLQSPITNKIVDIKLYDDHYLVVMEFATTALSIKQLKIFKFDFSLNQFYERTISSPYSLRFVEIFEFSNKILLCVNATSDIKSSVCFIEVTAPSDYKFNFVCDNMAAINIIPSQFGYVINTICDNMNKLIILDFNFNQTRVITLNNAKTSTLFYTAQNYYIFNTDTESCMQVYDNTFTTSKNMHEFDKCTLLTDIITYNNYALACFNCIQGLSIYTINSEKYILNFGTSEKNGKIATTKNGYFVIMESDMNSNEISNNFGKKDIGIVFIKL